MIRTISSLPIVMLLFASLGTAQSGQLRVDNKILPGEPGEIETINPVNGGVSFRIPIVSLKGRGLDINLSVNYNTKFWILGANPYIQPPSRWQATQPWQIVPWLHYTQTNVPPSSCAPWEELRGITLRTG